MRNLVTVEQARTHLRLDEFNETDETISNLIGIASSIVLTHIKASPDDINPVEPEDDIEPSGRPPDDGEVVPGNVQAATLLVLGDLYEHREGVDSNPLSQAVLSLLQSQRMPSMA